jgi:hypothetical protein
MWEVAGWKQLARVQPMQKAALHSVGYAPWGCAGLGMAPSIIMASGMCACVEG